MMVVDGQMDGWWMMDGWLERKMDGMEDDCGWVADDCGWMVVVDGCMDGGKQLSY